MSRDHESQVCKRAAAFMDIVDTFNHLIPSDQLDDSLLIGQNLECEAINEFGTGLHHLEDSLKNMLSDKDPMFGSASSQFNLLDNDDTNFQIAGATATDLNVGTADSGLPGAGGELTCAETPQVKRPVGRPRKNAPSVDCEQSDRQEPTNRKPPGRKPGPRRRFRGAQQNSSLIEKGVRGPQLKEELVRGGRINISDFDVGLWLNPVVVLRRLTVTVGGFRIELLPGPSYAAGGDAGQAICFQDGLAYSGEVEYVTVQEDTPATLDLPVETPRALGGMEKHCVDDLPLGLGPYVNPNDVQASNGPLAGKPPLVETKSESLGASEKPAPASKKLQGTANNSLTGSKTGCKEEMNSPKKQLKSKQGLSSPRSKNLVSGKPSNTTKGLKSPPHHPSKVFTKEDGNNMKPIKDQKGLAPLKRPGENSQLDHPAKVQRLQDGGTPKPKPKSPGTASSPVKKAFDNRLGEQQRPTKPAQPQPVGRPDATALSHGTPGHPPSQSSRRLSDEAGGQEKVKAKKPEKILHRVKSKNSRSISVEEPQLFIPDNAPQQATKKDTLEEQPANNEAVWDVSNNCGLCKKDHNNMFMVGCGRCDDWFHGDCVGLDLSKVREMEEQDQMYVCLKCCAEESARAEERTRAEERARAEADAKAAEQSKPDLHDGKPKQGPAQQLTAGGPRPARKDSERRQSADAGEGVQKTGQSKHEAKSKICPPSKKPVSVEEIRRSVRDSLKEILVQRLKESDLDVPPEKASHVAKKTERELFHLYKDTDSKYKSKYRSLMFNLKDTKNNVLFKRVLQGEIFPSHLVRMSPEELASKELAAWRQRENRHTIEMIEKEQREVERRPITKITHKGEIEIESEEPVKAPETIKMESEPPPKAPEFPAEIVPLEKNAESSSKDDKDTTSQHKSHLFDLHCKICTGRMAPPVEEAPTKVVKVSTTVVRRQSSTVEETKSAPASVKDDDLHFTVLEESLLKAKRLSGYEERSDYASGKDDKAAFLSSLQTLWRGFVNMHAVAKLVTKAFPVSGILENLTEDLPDSIQVGGRISPQIVWDYFEKIRATGTKEVCLIRFAPETEEDEISYTLLYAYFSSRKRFGVVANNRKNVKDMYIIPLGSTEKVPHQLVPFDGPGLESNRSNLLLGLIIRQKPKRDFLPVDRSETARFIPETKPLTVPTNDIQVKEDNFYLNTLIPTIPKEKENLLSTTEEADEPAAESLDEEPSTSEEASAQESKKPLRFLPGVLLGLGGLLPPLPDVGGKPLLAVDDPLKTQQAPKPDVGIPESPSKTSTGPRLDRFVIKKKEPKPVKAEPVPLNPPDTLTVSKLPEKDSTVHNPAAAVSLKDKPPDMTTEVFLASLASGNKSNCTVSVNNRDACLSSETEKGVEQVSLDLPKSEPASDTTAISKPPLSGILKKSSAYASVPEEKKAEEPPAGNGSNQPPPMIPQPVPVVSSVRNAPTPASQLGFLELSQEEYGLQKEIQSSVSSSYSEQADPNAFQTGTPIPTIQGDVVSRAPLQPEAPEFRYQSALAPTLPTTYSNALPFLAHQPQHQPQVPGNCGYQSVPTLYEPIPSHPQDKNNGAPWATLDGPTLASNPTVSPAKDCKKPDALYDDPWERTRQAESRDQHERHRDHGDDHHGKKSRHHDKERARRHERSSHDDRHRDRSRHRGHSKEDRHGEKRKERHHSDDYGNRHKDRHRHRRDSDHEKGRKSSRDSYS